MILGILLVKKEGEYMLTVAYVGFGNSVVRYHLPFIKNNKNVKVKWIYRREEDRLLPGEKERETLYPELKFTTDFLDVLKDPEVNLVSINTHVDVHYQYAKDALNAGKNVLVEKPFTNTVEEAQELFDLAEKKGLTISCNNNRRFDADMQTLKKVLDSKVLGDVVEIQSHYHYFRPGYQKADPNMPRQMTMVSGLAIHPIDQMVYLFGKPDKIRYDVRSVVSEFDDNIDIDFYYGKMKFTVKTSTTAKIDFPKFIAHGTQGSFIKNTQGHLSSNRTEPVVVSFEPEAESNWGHLSYLDKDGNNVDTYVQTEVSEYGKIYDNLDSVINGDGELVVKHEEILLVLNIVKEAEESLNK